MQIMITKSFKDPSSDAAFMPNELLDVPTVKAEEWIEAGNAVPLRSILTQTSKPVPARQKREKAVTV